MAYTAEDVVGLLGDSRFADSSDDDLGFEIEEYDNPYFHAASINGKNNCKYKHECKQKKLQSTKTH